jgi:NAD(P)-dependent dehydrogenase (short-subunit alcohol dehydrogenase family)
VYSATKAAVNAITRSLVQEHAGETGLRDAILAHPTMAEGLNALFSEVLPSSAD